MSIWPDAAASYGQQTFGGRRHGPSLDDLLLLPRLDRGDWFDTIARLGREPTPWDVDASVSIGGFDAAAPLIVPAMGSTAIAHEHGVALAQAAGAAGVPLVLGENIAAVHGYSKAKSPAGTTFKDRARAYLDAGGPGLVIQQSVEDAMDELWWHVYTDPDFKDAVAAGRIGFEIKVGQGAKPGLGGMTLLDADEAARLASEFAMDGAPRGGKVERFSAPGTFTPAILAAQLRHLGNDFPDVKRWVKLPGCRDLADFVRAADEAGADCITVDGAEAGTALAPSVVLDHLGVPTMRCAQIVTNVDPACDVVLSGGLTTGADAVKARCLGFAAAAFGRGPLQAAVDAGPRGAADWFADRIDEVRKLTYGIGRLRADRLERSDIDAPAPLITPAVVAAV